MKYLALLILSLGVFSKEILLTSRNTISFDQQFTDDYVAKKQLEVNNLIEKNRDIQEFYIVISSEGGSVTAGQSFFSFLKSFNKKFHTITLFASSMGFQMVQELDDRYITEYGVLMSHESYLNPEGQFSTEEIDRARLLKEKYDHISDSKAAKRAGISIKDYKELIKKELWLVGKEAVDKKFADAVVFPRCDPSLLGTTVETIRTILGVVEVKKSKCPLIKGNIED